MRKRRNYRKRNNDFKFFVIGCIAIGLFLSIGYGAFQTDINVNTKGTIKRFTVTFDPNGGLLDTSTKEVGYGSNYGDLPTPSKEGYTFLGWNGKNLFNEDEYLLKIPGAVYENGYYVFNPYNAHKLYGFIGNTGAYVGTETININFDDYEKYTFSMLGYSDLSISPDIYQSIFIGFLYKDGTVRYNGLYGATEIFRQITSDTNKLIDKVGISYGRSGGKVHMKYIQIEKGTEATAYEPYFITKDTKVVQKNDHTLTAIWKENS